MINTNILQTQPTLMLVGATLKIMSVEINTNILQIKFTLKKSMSGQL
jgi:hypothetical protein